MGLISEIRVSSAIKKITRGGSAKLSIADISRQFIYVSRAKGSFDDDVYNELVENFNATQRISEKKLMNQSQYETAISGILMSFDQIAPCEFYAGDGSAELNIMLTYILSKIASDEVRSLRRNVYWKKLEIESLDRTYIETKKLLDSTPNIAEIEKMGKAGKYPAEKVAGYKESRMQLERNMVEFPSERQKLLDEISVSERRLKALGWVE